jgi:hypothetical protein
MIIGGDGQMRKQSCLSDAAGPRGDPGGHGAQGKGYGAQGKGYGAQGKGYGAQGIGPMAGKARTNDAQGKGPVRAGQRSMRVESEDRP